MSVSINTSEKQFAVLAFHKIGEPPPDGWSTWYYIPEATFTQQLQYVCDSAWEVIDLRTFIDGLNAPDQLPQRSMLLTFDDGHRSMREIAFPILRRFGLSAVCFVPTDYIGGRSTFDTEVEPEEPMCDWDDLRELDHHGIAIQSHGVSHYWFSLMSEEQQERELIESKRILEDGLKKSVEAFAFPYSDAGNDLDAISGTLKRAGYRAAFLCGGGPSTNELPIGNPYRLSRLAMYRDTDLDLELNWKAVR